MGLEYDQEPRLVKYFLKDSDSVVCSAIYDMNYNIIVNNNAYYYYHYYKKTYKYLSLLLTSLSLS